MSKLYGPEYDGIFYIKIGENAGTDFGKILHKIAVCSSSEDDIIDALKDNIYYIRKYRGFIFTAESETDKTVKYYLEQYMRTLYPVNHLESYYNAFYGIKDKWLS